MAGLRAVHRREEQSAHHAAQVGDPLLVDCRQRSQRQPAQVEVGASLSLILEAFGCGGAQRGAGRLIEQRVLGGEGGGHGRNSYTNPYAARSILYPFLFLKHPPSGGCSADCGASWSFRKMAREPYGRTCQAAANASSAIPSGKCVFNCFCSPRHCFRAAPRKRCLARNRCWDTSPVTISTWRTTRNRATTFAASPPPDRKSTRLNSSDANLS